MEHFLLLVTKPDNVPIVAIVLLLPFFTWLAFSQGRRNDLAGAPAEAALNDKVYCWPYLCRNEFSLRYYCNARFGDMVYHH